ncbi:TPA: hypothetical protein ACG7GD_000606 [Streptococcus agalactiae]
MVSYEKVRRSLRTATITIIVLNSLSLVFRLFTGISVQLAKTEINKGNTGNLPKEHIEAVLSATTPFMLFVTALIVLVNIAIVIFCIKNLRAIKRNYLPYYLGFAITVGLVILGFLTTKAPWAIAINIVFQAIFGLLYFHAYQKAQKLNERDLEETN